jgi:hypothetical protein
MKSHRLRRRENSGKPEDEDRRLLAGNQGRDSSPLNPETGSFVVRDIHGHPEMAFFVF